MRKSKGMCGPPEISDIDVVATVFLKYLLGNTAKKVVTACIC